jgi:hypothetical protein
MSGPYQQPPQQPSGPYQYQGPQQGVMPPKLPKGFAVAGLVLGIIGLVFSLTPLGIGAGLICDILGIIFGGIGVSKAKRGQAGGKGMAMAGLVCGIIGIVMVIIWIFVLASDPMLFRRIYNY